LTFEGLFIERPNAKIPVGR